MKRAFVTYLILCFFIPISIDAKKKPFGKGLYWELDDNGVLTISGNGYMPNYGYPSKKDAPWHKHIINRKIYRVIIENGVKSIGANSFYHPIEMQSYITSIEIANSVTLIEHDAFHNCNIRTIDIPNSVRTIAAKAFYGCKSLVSITLPNSITKIEEGTFTFCSNLSVVNIPNTVKNIGREAFFACKRLYSIDLPNSITTIEENAFQYCENLNSIELPNSLTSLGDEAFVFCTKLKSIKIPLSLKKIGHWAFGIDFEGEIKSLPAWLQNDLSACETVGLSKSSVTAYKNGVKDNSGNLLLSQDADREIVKKTDENNLIYYIVINKANSSKGIINTEGKWVVPIQTIFSNYSDIDLLEGKFVRVKKDGYFGIYTTDGKELIPTNRGYTTIKGLSVDDKCFFYVLKGNFEGKCDSNGKEIIMKKIPLKPENIKSIGGYADASELKDGNTRYYKVSKGGRYGLTDSEGRGIIPCEMEALESAGIGYLKYKINGFWGVMNYTGKIIIDTDRGYTSIGDFKTFNKRFAYTMTGYKGECDAIGRQISKIKVETPKQNTQVSNYSDMKLFGLKGKVKKCIWSGKSVPLYDYPCPVKSISFSSNGKLRIDGYDIERDSKGRITKIKIKSGSDSYYYYYDSQNRIEHLKAETSGIFGSYVNNYYYSYDSSDRVISSYRDNLDTDKTYYEYKNSDSKGNWTVSKKKVGRFDVENTRKIEYY